MLSILSFSHEQHHPNGTKNHNSTPCLLSDQMEYTHNEQCSWSQRKPSTVSWHCFDSFMPFSVLESLEFSAEKTEPWFWCHNHKPIICHLLWLFSKGFCCVPHSTHFSFKHWYGSEQECYKFFCMCTRVQGQSMSSGFILCILALLP